MEKERTSLGSDLDFADRTVLNVFERNKHWDQMLLVADITGSMSEYSAQIILWENSIKDKKKGKISQ